MRTKDEETLKALQALELAAQQATEILHGSSALNARQNGLSNIPWNVPVEMAFCCMLRGRWPFGCSMECSIEGSVQAESSSARLGLEEQTTAQLWARLAAVDERAVDAQVSNVLSNSPSNVPSQERHRAEVQSVAQSK